MLDMPIIWWDSASLSDPSLH